MPIDESDLTRHYLNDTHLVDFIKAAQPNWKPDQGACSRCLETYYNEYSSQISHPRHGEENTEEKTIVSESDELVKEQAQSGDIPCLITIHGAELGKKFDLLTDETLIGRGETAHIRINEENVSRLHAIVMRKGDDLILEDQNSTNGTFVNTRKIKSKPLRDGDLVLIGNTILKFMSTFSIEHQYHEEIYRLATIDGLTGLFNKNFFLDRLAEEFSRSKRYDRSLSLLFFDFDHFKRINDTHGHLAGDEILKKASSLIQRNLRKEDLCGRYGGEEFGVLLPETPHKNALFLAEKLRKLVESTSFEHAGKAIPVTISFGVSTLTKDVKNPTQFVEMVDQALYRAKQAGRNCVKA
ncbi:MAG: GGDEF domain-containing protein [Pseudomonadota bacterium]